MVVWGSEAVVLSVWGHPLVLGGAGGVWFGPDWVAGVIWGRVWWRSVAVWVEGVSKGAAWLGDSIV